MVGTLLRIGCLKGVRHEGTCSVGFLISPFCLAPAWADADDHGREMRKKREEAERERRKDAQERAREQKKGRGLGKDAPSRKHSKKIHERKARGKSANRRGK